MTSRIRSTWWRFAAPLASCCLLACASTQSGGGSDYGPPPIPEGKGRLFLEAGGIQELNFFVEDAESGEIVYEDMPRASAFSPSAFERSWSENRLVVDLDPGTYDVTVNTDIKDSIVERGVKIQMGQEAHVVLQLGRVQVLITGGQGFTQIPFLFLDYTMRTVLGRGMTTGELRYFILPVGTYKLRLENSPSGLDEIRSFEVAFGRPTPVIIDLGTETQEGPETQQQEPQR